MNKEELLKMARDAGGIDFSYSEFDRQNQAEVNEVQLKALYNAILERAAVECEKRVLEVSCNYHDKCCDYTNGEVKGAEDCIAVIRAIKTQGD